MASLRIVNHVPGNHIMVQRIALLLLLTTLSVHLHADPLEGDSLYRVTTVRAAPGKLSELIDAVKASVAGTADKSRRAMPMRHSQGDQWDLMIITPMASFGDHFANDSKLLRSGLFADLAGLIAYESDIFALGPAVETVRGAYEDNNLYHIEMFAAVAGMSELLAEQRRMENRYLAATGQVPNMIFRRVAGSDVDVFTIGFHKSLAAFAAPAPASDAEKEVAAKAAGFKDRADLSFYLRSLISGHHDTFAVKID